MDWPGDGTLIASCGGGAEPALEAEIRRLGWTVLHCGSGAIRFRGFQRELIDANLRLRCASRVYVPIAAGTVRTYDDLYRLARRPAWGRIVPARLSIAVVARTRDPRLTDSRLAALKVKDAVVDSQRRSGKRSNVDRRNPQVPISVFVEDGMATISLDGSGSPLHERGYRVEAGEAPLRETVAAAMVELSGWDATQPLVDPFCGSGTIVIEAALRAAGIAPGARRSFAFESWSWIDSQAVEALRAALRPAGEPAAVIVGRDCDPRMVAIAERNARRAGVDRWVRFEQADALSAEPPAGPGLVITNPPYGERSELAEARTFYSTLGDRLKRSYGGWEAWILSANRDALKGLGLRLSSRHQLWNGGLDARLCRLVLYPAADGS